MIATSAAAAAPAPPGGIGSAPAPAELQGYLNDLDGWLRARRSELDELDAAALANQRGQVVSADMALSLALWKAVHDRFQLMWSTWDGGRVGVPERERIATLIWGRLDNAVDAGPQAVAVSLPEACRLSDALAVQLRATLTLAPGATEAAARIRDLRAQAERIRDQVGLEPAVARDAAVHQLAAVMSRLDDIADRAQRGGDVGGMLGPLENDATTLERDLIVGNARRREARDQLTQVRELRTELEAREHALQGLADTCVQTVEPAPVLAVPDVDALGPVPNTPDLLGEYANRLGRVEQALAFAEQRYATALGEHRELADLLDAWVAKAKAVGAAPDADLTAAEQQARELLARRPVPMPVARHVVATYQVWLEHLSTRRPRPSTPTLGTKEQR